ncbi:hypothetical protein GGX14DRAFT_700921 [Mycena pura]|uniref:Uncharacterized protein n=1 Tax=Mycena pura TaxID=153505 RepID=A0AAD6V0Q0_9AGAR|nr:hypothetical protein GGX14DRAFT_700921 [Mycena pura]
MPLFQNHHTMDVNALRASCPEPACTRVLPGPRKARTTARGIPHVLTRPMATDTRSGISVSSPMAFTPPPNSSAVPTLSHTASTVI